MFAFKDGPARLNLPPAAGLQIAHPELPFAAVELAGILNNIRY